MTTSTTSNKPTNRWRFVRAGGFDQVRLERGSDLAALNELDQKLWVALACPTTGLEFDAKTLALIDTDKDGRIRAPEILAATRWAVECLKDPDELLKGASALPLSAINEASAEGKQLLASARQILDNLGKKDAEAITLEDTSDTVRIFAQTMLNGDGIVPAEAANDEATKAVMTDIIFCVGSEADRGGKPGVTLAKVEQFFTAAQAYVDWAHQSDADPQILPLGPATGAAFGALSAVKAKVDDYFARCRLAAFDPRAVGALNRPEAEYLALASKDFGFHASEVAGFPLARIEPGKPLALEGALNPAWADGISKLKSDVLRPLLGERTTLTEAEWVSLNQRFAAYRKWQESKAGAEVERLGLKRVREILGGKHRTTITELIARDKALEPEANAIASVDKLVRLHRDLYKLLNNFVTFRDFYSRKEKAIFQAGTLYLDQRSCDLCLRVEDAGRHATMAGLAGAYLAYCDCVRKATGEKIQMVAAFTDGDSDNLMVGRNGIFYDRKGRDWDATITKIIDNPISIRQAFWSPYKRLVRMVEEQVAKRAAAADAASTHKMTSLATTTANLDQQKPGEPKKLDVGVVAALGVAVGAIGTAISALVTGLLKLPGWQMPLVFLGLLLMISGPAMFIAWLKLRKRNLGPILDANGWAVNARALINLPFGGMLTKVATLPPNAERNLVDPYAESHSGRNQAITAIILALTIWILWNFGVIERVLPNVFPKSTWVQQRQAAATTKAPEAPAPPAAPTTPTAPATK